MPRAVTPIRYDRQTAHATTLHRLPNCTGVLKPISFRFLFIAEYRGRKQLRGFRPMPFLERFLIESDIVHNIREPTGVERPRFEVANNLDFGESDYNCIQGNSDVAGPNLPDSPHG